MQNQPPLSNLQLELLKVFSRNVSDEDLIEIKTLLANYFAQKATNLADVIWEQEGFTDETMNTWRQKPLRTAYSPQPQQKGNS